MQQSRTPLPFSIPSSQFFIDESGSKGSGGRFFVMAALKTRHPGLLLRRVLSIQDAHWYRDELKFGSITRGSVVSCLCLDSRSTPGLQLADLVAGSIAFERKRSTETGPMRLTPKAQVALELRNSFGLVDFSDQRSDRVNILTARTSTSQHNSIRGISTT